MDFIEHLKSSADIVRVVGEYVRLRKTGVRWVGLCPFHTEKTPSFGVHETYQIFKCFGCGAAGDVIKFVQEIEGLTFWEAVKLLAERHGIPLPRRADFSDEQTRLRAGIYEMHEVALKHFRSLLESAAGAEARAYLSRRGVGPQLVEEFSLGFADRGGQSLTRRLQQAGFQPEQMEKSGLVIARNDGSGLFDRFRGRVIFPIHNESGKVIAFAGRALSSEDEPKYLNSPETDIYRKSYVLYNLHRARKPARDGGFSILVEGYMDVIGLHGAGVHNAIASCGTALTAQQVRCLKRHVDNIVVNFDPDAAGSNAAERSINTLLEEAMHIRVLELDGGLDPDEYVKQRGADSYLSALKNAPRYFEWLAGRARQKFDVRSAEGRVAGFRFLLPAIRRIPSRIERAAIANDVAAYLGVESSLVLAEFRSLAAERSPAPKKAATPGVPQDEKILLRCLLGSEEARRQVLPEIASLAPSIKLRTARILDSIAAAGEPFHFAALEGRLHEEDRELLSALVFAEDMNEQEISAQQALACLQRIRVAARESDVAGLKARIKAAERAGNVQQALALAAELNRLGRV